VSRFNTETPKEDSGLSAVKDVIAKTANVVFLLLFAVLTVYPFFWVLLSSVKDNPQIFGSPFSLPDRWVMSNYSRILEATTLGTNMLNSLVVSVVTTVVVLLLSAMASYVLSRVRPSLALYTYFTIGIMIPTQMILIPSFVLLKSISLLNTRLGLTLLYVVGGMPLAILLLVAHMRTIPVELEESASLDGCSRSRSFVAIVLPLSRSGLATAGILTFIHSWNEYVLAYIVISDKLRKTITQGIYQIRGEFFTDYGLLSAGMVLAIIPVILVYIAFQEQVVKGMTAGALKG
jgi:raffinose/stachyose/melibiose transport system permease protein